MNENNKRFREAFDYLRFTKKTKDITSFAIQLGKNRSYISQILNDKIAVKKELLMFMQYKFRCFNLEWLLSGKGEMLLNTTKENNIVDANNASNSIVGYSNNNCNVIVGGDGDKMSDGSITPNKYGDSPSTERAWKPVVPSNIARQPDFDIMGHIEKQINGNFERLYSGTAPVDIWHYLEDNDLYPFFQKGDCLGLKAYPLGDTRIKTGDVYAVDTKRDGLIVRRCRLSVEGDIVTYTYNDTDPQEFVIPKDDVIRIFKKVLMFRY